MKETNKTTNLQARLFYNKTKNLQARLFYNTVLYCLGLTLRYSLSLLASVLLSRIFAADERVCLNMHRLCLIDNWLHYLISENRYFMLHSDEDIRNKYFQIIKFVLKYFNIQRLSKYSSIHLILIWL